MQTVKTAIHDRIGQVANNVCNERLGNIEFEMNSILTYLTELSYHEDVNDVILLCTNALELLTNVSNTCRSATMDIAIESLVPAVYCGSGRPFLVLPEDTLEYFIGNSFTIKQMASILSVSEKTIKNPMKDYGLSIR